MAVLVYYNMSEWMNEWTNGRELNEHRKDIFHNIREEEGVISVGNMYLKTTA